MLYVNYVSLGRICALLSPPNFTKALNIFKHLGMACISSRTYYRHQQAILQVAIRKVWKDRQDEMFSSCREEQRDLVIGADGRADTPGHSAKYGTYTMMDMEKLAVLNVEIIQVSGQLM